MSPTLPPPPHIFLHHSVKLLSPTLPILMNSILLSPPPLSSDPAPPKIWIEHLGVSKHLFVCSFELDNSTVLISSEMPQVTQEIRKCGFWCKLPLFDHFCGAPMQLMKISDFPIYSFTNDLLPSSLYDLVFMKRPNCAPCTPSDIS